MADTPKDDRRRHDKPHTWHPAQGPRGPKLPAQTAIVSKKELRLLLDGMTFGCLPYRTRIKKALEDGTLPPVLELAIWEATYPAFRQRRRTDLTDLVEGMGGLINMVMRRPLNEDPLAQAKPVDAKVVQDGAPILPALTAGQIQSVIPPSKPRKPTGRGAPLKPGEEAMP